VSLPIQLAFPGFTFSVLYSGLKKLIIILGIFRRRLRGRHFAFRSGRPNQEHDHRRPGKRLGPEVGRVRIQAETETV